MTNRSRRVRRSRNRSGNQTASRIEEGLRYHAEGRLDRARHHYQAVLERNPRNCDALHLLGVIAHQEGNQPEAIRLITAAVECSPGQSMFHNNLGEAYRASGALPLPRRHTAPHCAWIPRRLTLITISACVWKPGGTWRTPRSTMNGRLRACRI